MSARAQRQRNRSRTRRRTPDGPELRPVFATAVALLAFFGLTVTAELFGRDLLPVRTSAVIGGLLLLVLLGLVARVLSVWLEHPVDLVGRRSGPDGSTGSGIGGWNAPLGGGGGGFAGGGKGFVGGGGSFGGGGARGGW